MKMKTWGLIGIVVALHCAVIGSVCFISGCGTPRASEVPPETPIMPSPAAPRAAPAAAPSAPAVKPAAAVPAPAKESRPTGGGEYIVQPGDTLGAIAKRCGVTQAELIEANQITNPNRIRAGQKLVLPPTGKAPAPLPKPAAKPQAKPAAEAPVLTGENEYVVKAGDNLSKIAARFGVKLSALREANKLQSDKLRIAQKLIIPPAAAAAPQVPAAPVPVPAPAAAPEPAATLPAATVSAPAPAPESAAPVAAPAVTLAPSAPPEFISGIVHTVQVDEDLSSIAKLYTVTVEEIAELNQLPPDHAVQPGQRLKIP